MELQINNLVKRFGNKVALDIPELQIEKGTLLGLVGNNGRFYSGVHRWFRPLANRYLGKRFVFLR